MTAGPAGRPAKRKGIRPGSQPGPPVPLAAPRAGTGRWAVDDGVEPDVDVSAPWARARTLVVAAREELEIADGALTVLQRS